jgi:nucleoside-diphosphate-sugar epimerase
MVRIGILGANGQVGSEVCLFLSQMKDVKVIPICRTELGSALLRRCGLECRHGTLGKATEATRLLADCDLVADFTLPQDNGVSEIRAAIKRTIRTVMLHAPADAPFVYISSLMAFGVSPNDQTFRPRLWSRTLYGSTKRYAERLVFRLGKRSHRDVYVLRLGQVHGELQSVSRSIMRRLEEEAAYVPVGRSYVVFTYTIAEALVKIATGKEKPGRYSLISAPDWSWTEVYEYYARRAGHEPNMVTFEFGAVTRSSRRQVESLARRIANPVIQSASQHRESITSYFLRPFPKLEQRFRAVWGLRRARAEVSQMIMLKRQGQYRPFNVQGEVPGERLRSISDCRTGMILPVMAVQRLLQNVVREKHISDSPKLQESLTCDVAATALVRPLR